MRNLTDRETRNVSGGIENDYNCMCVKDSRPHWSFTSFHSCVASCCNTNDGGWTYTFQSGKTTSGHCSD